MKKFVAVAFTCGGKLILQRRDSGAPNNPNALGFFGGRVEPGEAAEEALRREITEETDLDVPNLELKHVFDVKIPVGAYGSEEGTDSVYQCDIAVPSFKVKEGQGAEIYSLEQLFARDDLAPYSRVILNRLKRI